MTTNAGIVSGALKYVTQMKEQVNTLQKLDERVNHWKRKKQQLLLAEFPSKMLCSIQTSAARGTGNKSLLVYRNRKKEEVCVLVTVGVYFNYGLRYSLL